MTEIHYALYNFNTKMYLKYYELGICMEQEDPSYMELSNARNLLQYYPEFKVVRLEVFMTII